MDRPHFELTILIIVWDPCWLHPSSNIFGQTHLRYSFSALPWILLKRNDYAHTPLPLQGFFAGLGGVSGLLAYLSHHTCSSEEGQQ